MVWALLGALAGWAGVASAQEAPPAATKKPAAKRVQAPRTPESAVTPAPHVPKRHEEFMKRKQAGPIGLLFIGDSITDFWPKRGPETWAKFQPYQVADFGVSGDRTEHVLWRIDHGELDGLKPKVTVIMIGTNNVGQCKDEKPQWAANGVKKILDQVREKMPETKVLLLAVFPRGKADSELRKKVADINDIISKYGDEPNVTYLDIGKAFLDENGEIPRDVMADSLHPTAKGYQMWYDAMWPTLDKMLK